jgi:hypothetical protein
MELTDLIRNEMLQTIQNQIDGDAGIPGRIEFYDNTGTLLALVSLSPISMVITKGTGIFVDVMPYLRGIVVAEGIAKSWILFNADNLPIFNGSCGDADHIITTKDIIFNSGGLDWHVNDVIIIEELSLEIPVGHNDYILV